MLGFVAELDRTTVTDALAAIYGQIGVAVEGLDESELMKPSRCAGWTVADVLYHELLDARRALVTFASPATQPADVDDVTYWHSYRPGDPGMAAHARHVRVVASAYSPGMLAREWQDTAAAAVRAARACPHDFVTTQGHVLKTTDFVATLVVEATVHYLDLTAPLASGTEPDPAALALVRRTLDGLLGARMPPHWDERGYALKGTGRMPLTNDDRAALGSLASRFPLFG